MMILDDEYKGKPVFVVNFSDFCKIMNRSERRTKFSLDNQELMDHIINTRYSKNYVIYYEGIMYFPDK